MIELACYALCTDVMLLSLENKKDIGLKLWISDGLSSNHNRLGLAGPLSPKPPACLP